MGVTVRELNGWAPAVAVFGPDGELLRVEVPQPRFTPREKNLLLASRRDEKLRGEHGVLMSEATDPANRYAFSVPNPTRDWAALALAQKQREYRKKYPDAEMDGLLWRVKFDPTATSAQPTK